MTNKFKFVVLLISFFAGISASVAENWECRAEDGLVNLYCGGSRVEQYFRGKDCVQGRKQFCDPEPGKIASAFECKDESYHSVKLYCGGALIESYYDGKECVKGRKDICD